MLTDRVAFVSLCNDPCANGHKSVCDVNCYNAFQILGQLNLCQSTNLCNNLCKLVNLQRCNKRKGTLPESLMGQNIERTPAQSMVSCQCKRDISSWKKSYLKISILFKVLPFHIKIYTVEIFTRATPGSCLVFHIGLSRFTNFVFASQSLRLHHQI